MEKYLNLIGWFTFADGRREFLSTFKGGRIDLALAVMEHGEVVGFSTEKQEADRLIKRHKLERLIKRPMLKI